jgi:hypothetical protein
VTRPDRVILQCCKNIDSFLQCRRLHVRDRERLEADLGIPKTLEARANSDSCDRPTENTAGLVDGRDRVAIHVLARDGQVSGSARETHLKADGRTVAQSQKDTHSRTHAHARAHTRARTHRRTHRRGHTRAQRSSAGRSVKGLRFTIAHLSLEALCSAQVGDRDPKEFGTLRLRERVVDLRAFESPSTRNTPWKRNRQYGMEQRRWTNTDARISTLPSERFGGGPAVA